MPDSRFFVSKSSMSLAAAVKAVGGDGALSEGDQIVRIGAPGEDDLHGAVVFCDNKTTATQLSQKNFGLCLATDKLAHSIGAGPIITIASPKLGFAILSMALHVSREDLDLEPKNTARISKTANIHASAVISDGAQIGEGVKIGPHCYIGYGVIIGAGATIGAGVSITHAILGDNVHILPGARIGEAGFGFVEAKAGPMRIPQLGRVMVGNHVEIGANTTIDRGALGDTVIGEGTKIDNLIQIGHNVQIGRYCILAAQVGISGSCVIGDGVMLGGQVGLTEHLKLGDTVRVAAGTGLMHDIPAGETWAGRPGQPIKAWLREVAIIKRLAKKKNG